MPVPLAASGRYLQGMKPVTVAVLGGLAVVLYAAVAVVEDPAGQYETLALHTVLAVLVLAFTNATSAHAIARAAHKRGHKPVQAVCDRLQEDPPS